MTGSLLWLLAACIRTVWSQNDIPSGSFRVGGSNALCNRSLADANGTSIWEYNPQLRQGPGAGAYDEANGLTLPVSVAITLLAGQNSSYPTQYSFWFSPNGANYTNDVALGFDMCGIVAAPFSQRVEAIAAKDNGSCDVMLGSACSNALQSNAEAYATQLVLSNSFAAQNSSSGTNATNVLAFCSQVSQMINSNLPEECKSTFNDGAGGDASATKFIAAVPLTSLGQSTASYNESCRLDNTYYNIATLDAVNNSIALYDELAYTAIVGLLLYTPLVDLARKETNTQSKAGVRCGHITTFNEGSRVPPLPAIPGAKSSGLSKGAIAGIVIGAIVAVAITAGAAWTFYTKRGKSGTHRADGNKSLVEVDGSNVQMVQAPDSHFPKGYSGGYGHHLQEMDGGGREPMELEGESGPVPELGAHDAQRHRKFGDTNN